METLSSYKIQSWLLWFLRGMLILSFLVLTARIFDLQIIKGNYFKSLAEENRVKYIPILAPRGEILARGGEVLVGNKTIKRGLVFDEQTGFKKVADVSQIPENEIIDEPLRDYIIGQDFSHVSGYLGEVSEDELGKIKAQCPLKGPRRIGEYVGRTGLEEQYDCILSGIDGEELVEVDAYGKRIRTLGRRDPIPGDSIHTTIDFGLQKKVAELMSGKKGAVVITDANGQVYAFYSSPSYDPNIFVDEERRTRITGILNDTDLPLFNRVSGGKFHPGSTYKPIVAISALEEGAIDENYTFDDAGQIVIQTAYGTFSYKNWYFTQYGGTEGVISLDRALARSTDTFFYKIGELTGVDALVEWSEKFRLNEKSGIDIPGEVPGFIPSPSWKIKTKGERWFLGNTYHMSIGQGDVSLTPIGLHTAVLSVANGGRLCTPHFINEDSMHENFKCDNLGITDKNIDFVKKGMVAACSSGGTGYTFFDFEEKSGGTKVGCKTGTAQTENGEPHAWFVAFAPSDSPEFSLTVMVENGGEGSRVAGPIARDIFNYWYKVPTPTPTLTITPTPVP